MQNLSQITLGECLSLPDQTIRRNAMSILKRLQDGVAYKCGCGRIYNIGDECDECRVNNT